MHVHMPDRKLLPVKQPSTYAFNLIISKFELKIWHKRRFFSRLDARSGRGHGTLSGSQRRQH
jgi:hypothetical protein